MKTHAELIEQLHATEAADRAKWLTEALEANR
jgi:hypothetical protein